MKFLVFIISCLTLEQFVNAESILVEKRNLYAPSLFHLAGVLKRGLRRNFAEVRVEVVYCPDLTQDPFQLSASGLGGNTKIVDIGSTSYLAPLPNREKIYDIRQIAKLVESNYAFIIGPGAGPFPYVGGNGEGVYNTLIKNGIVKRQDSRVSIVDVHGDRPIQLFLPKNETRFALIGNLFFSDGLRGPVLQIYVKKRIGPENFAAAIRLALQDEYKNELVGLGGVFLILRGTARIQVMPDFSTTPLRTRAQFDQWLRIYNMSAPLTSVGTLVNGDEGLDLRPLHFHTFNDYEAGHYQNDTTPDSVEYLGYFNVGREIFRIDRSPTPFTWDTE